MMNLNAFCCKVVCVCWAFPALCLPLLQMGFALQLKWQNGFYSWCVQGWPQAAAHLKGFKRKSASNCHKQLPSMIFLWLASPVFNPPHLKVAVTPQPSFFGIHKSFLIPSLPLPAPASYPLKLSGCSCFSFSLSLFCLSSLFCRKAQRLSDAAGIRQLWRIFRYASFYLSVPFPRKYV